MRIAGWFSFLKLIDKNILKVDHRENWMQQAALGDERRGGRRGGATGKELQPVGDSEDKLRTMRDKTTVNKTRIRSRQSWRKMAKAAS